MIVVRDRTPVNTSLEGIRFWSLMYICTFDDIGVSLVEIMHFDKKSKNMDPTTLVTMMSTENIERIPLNLI